MGKFGRIKSGRYPTDPGLSIEKKSAQRGILLPKRTFWNKPKEHSTTQNT
jgi:hypothetical protein